MYAIIRADHPMTRLKACSQTGHAYLDAFSKASPEIVAAYRDPVLGGTKVALIAPDEAALRHAHGEAVARGLPCALIDDDGVIVALGIGPVMRADAKPITKGFPSRE